MKAIPNLKLICLTKNAKESLKMKGIEEDWLH